MPRAVVLALLVAAATGWAANGPATLPPEFAGAKQTGAPTPLVYPDKALAEEWGLEGAESAEYAGPERKFKVSVWRLKDPTAAFAFFEASRDPKAIPNPEFKKTVVDEPNGVRFLTRGNYCLRFTGWAPKPADLDGLFHVLPKLDQASLPNLLAYFPVEGRKANSERLILGPASLDRFESRITPGMAAFSMGAEGAAVTYGDGTTLTIFNYPTPQIARERVEEFRKAGGAVVKRSGPLAIVALGAPDASAAERLLAKVEYKATLTWNEGTPDVEVRKSANFLLGAFTLAGIVILMCAGAGIAFGLIRVTRPKSVKGEEEAPMIRLGLDNS
ncbi:hypothetical protein F183_A49200 [Bryobacterales bacterium F-183]|nr:hypothetical protein F183_A49200 [Bryobacterales bacterium F-183]